MIKFLSWFIKPLGYRIVPMENTLVMQFTGKDLDRDLELKLIDTILSHEPETKDNIVRFDKYV